MNVLLGVCGSIAAYKSLELLRLLSKQGYPVKVMMTHSALNFIAPLSFQTLSKNDVYIEQFILNRNIRHIALSEWADIAVIAPATCNIIGKVAQGIADDLLSTTLTSFQGPIIFVPAMDQGMWENKVVQNNVAYLKENGYYFVEPGFGPLASGKVGRGRFPSLERIYHKILAVYEKQRLLQGKKFLITGGRTEENLDPVRTITNRSTGAMAAALFDTVIARDGLARGIFGEVSIALPQGEILRVRTSGELLNGLKENIAWCDFLLMVAAIGDYRPITSSEVKIHKERVVIELEKNIDLLKEIKPYKKDKIFVGFSLEEQDEVPRARKKMKEKGLDIIVLNSTAAIGQDEIQAKIMRTSGEVVSFSQVSKHRLADAILDECLNLAQQKK